MVCHFIFYLDNCKITDNYFSYVRFSSYYPESSGVLYFYLCRLSTWIAKLCELYANNFDKKKKVNRNGKKTLNKYNNVRYQKYIISAT